MAEPTAPALVFVVLMTISGTNQTQGEREPFPVQPWRRLHIAQASEQPTMEACEAEKPRTIQRWRSAAEYMMWRMNPADPFLQNERRWTIDNVEGQCIGVSANAELPTDQMDD